MQQQFVPAQTSMLHFSSQKRAQCLLKYNFIDWVSHNIRRTFTRRLMRIQSICILQYGEVYSVAAKRDKEISNVSYFMPVQWHCLSALDIHRISCQYSRELNRNRATHFRNVSRCLKALQRVSSLLRRRVTPLHSFVNILIITFLQQTIIKTYGLC